MRPGRPVRVRIAGRVPRSSSMPRLASLAAATALTVLATASSASADTIIAGGNLPGAANTWTTAGSPYILQGDVTVPAGAMLTIEAGVEVRATANSDSQIAGQNTSRVELTVDGTLHVNGTAAAPVTLHSSTTTAGSWYGVIASPTSTVTFTHAAIQHAIFGLVSQALGTTLQTSNLTIQSASSYGLYLRAGNPTLDKVAVIGAGNFGIFVGDSASPTLTSCVVRNSGGYGVYVAHTSAGRSVTLDNCTLNANGTYGVYTGASAGNGATIAISDSIITNASYGIYRADAAAITVTNTNVWNNATANFNGVAPGTGALSANPLYVSATDLRLTSNSPSRFGASGGVDQGALPYDVVPTPGLYGTLWSNTTLTAAQSPYTSAGDLTVADGVTLTIEPGVTLSFQASSDIMLAGANASRGELIVRGRLIADGTPAGPIAIGSTSATSGSLVRRRPRRHRPRQRARQRHDRPRDLRPDLPLDRHRQRADPRDGRPGVVVRPVPAHRQPDDRRLALDLRRQLRDLRRRLGVADAHRLRRPQQRRRTASTSRTPAPAARSRSTTARSTPTAPTACTPAPRPATAPRSRSPTRSSPTPATASTAPTPPRSPSPTPTSGTTPPRTSTASPPAPARCPPTRSTYRPPTSA